MDIDTGNIGSFITFLIFSYIWLALVIWTNFEVKKKGGNIKLYNSLVFLLGPVGVLIYYLFPNMLAQQGHTQTQTSTKIRQRHSKTAGKDKEVLQIVDKFLHDAIAYRATDIHLEPSKDRFTIRFRIDGFLYEYRSFPTDLGKPITSATKVISELDIAQKRSFQDGSFSQTIHERKIDFRVSISASHYGETIVIRVLDPKEGLVDINHLGVLPEVEDKFHSIVFRNDGIVLIVGPTGCGKTTTLYAVLNKVNNLGKNIISIEDPIEYKIANITQIPVNPRAGVTFANSLRSILRQDPDIIMVGEIRDIETAKIALEASLTGHLVFSTLHTRDSVSTVTRLFEMGFEPYLISSSLAGVISQRLVRVLCPKCKTPYTLQSDIHIGHDKLRLKTGEKVYKPKGCNFCTNTGYRGRTGLFEILIVDKKIKELVSKKTSNDELFTYAREQGLMTLLEDGVRKIREGITSIEEIEGVLK